MWNHSYLGGYLRSPNGETYEPHISWPTRRSWLGIHYKKGIWNIWKAGSLWAAAHRENNVYFLQELHQAHMITRIERGGGTNLTRVDPGRRRAAMDGGGERERRSKGGRDGGTAGRGVDRRQQNGEQSSSSNKNNGGIR